MGELVEVEPGRWRIVKPTIEPARSALPCPHIISDIMPATEQVDGKFYTSKSAFRSAGRSLGLTEMGNEKPKPKVRSTGTKEVKEARRQALRRAAARFRAGDRPRTNLI